LLSALGLVYYGHRYYSPTLGRFICRDPKEEDGGRNLYAFLSNQTPNRWDYLGLSWDSDNGDSYLDQLDRANMGDQGSAWEAHHWMGDTTTTLVSGTYRDANGNIKPIPAGTTVDDIRNANHLDEYGNSTRENFRGTAGTNGTGSADTLALDKFVVSQSPNAANLVIQTLQQMGRDLAWGARENLRMIDEHVLRPIDNAIVAAANGASYVGDQVLPGSGEGVRSVVLVGSLLLGPGKARAVTAAESGLVMEIRGGTYLLRNAETGQVMRTGRTNDLTRRAAEHNRNSILRDFDFEPVHRTDVYEQQRGLEQLLHDIYQPPLNKVRPISPANPNLPLYQDAANTFLGNP